MHQLLPVRRQALQGSQPQLLLQLPPSRREGGEGTCSYLLQARRRRRERRWALLLLLLWMVEDGVGRLDALEQAGGDGVEFECLQESVAVGLKVHRNPPSWIHIVPH